METTMSVAAVEDRIERVLVLPAPRERVWAALTEPERMVGWFGTRVELDLRPGGDAFFGWGEDLFRAIVVAVEPTSRFAFRWTAGKPDPRMPVAASPNTLVEFTLENAAEGTRLTLVESGFASLPEEMRARSLADNQGGWREELGHLAAYIAGLPANEE